MIRNPGVLFQKLAADAALWRALGRIDFKVGQAICDIGGGSGGSLVPFMELGCPASTLTSIDRDEKNTSVGRLRFPGVNFVNCDASQTGLPGASFDVVYSSTIFLQIADENIAHGIGREMRRLVKAGGYIVVRDWAIADPRERQIAVTRKRIRLLFDLPILFTTNGALLPPVGRRLSTWMPWLYFLIHGILPVGQKVFVLRAPQQ